MQSQVFLLIVFAVCVLVQLACMLFNKNLWPFVAQSMFAYRYNRFIKCMFVLLIDEIEREVLVLPERVLPVASFRAQRMLIDIFSPGSSELAAGQFAESMLFRLNHNPWRGFDEIEPSVRPLCGKQYIGFKLYMCELDLDLVPDLSSGVGVAEAIIRRHILYEYFSRSSTFREGDLSS